ncbi:TetR/AcrR family transcriptional regulator [Desulfosudis oleivorans]|uniref:Transcriptional regulator, TetR family n=1 Tax=Desulfosudis oleivorans (strain DSM 6200 / JCM 39069 / Hxd3) TaxID=96561 RepID=A8ZTK3_DESOH|nr:TetR/AcrR family transcriptional regulator [Desulfosudis oleivorans]ABW66267.1 transcriptional regulator, TetR family [Desulfosudis oleivorans Hxd3]
MKKPNTIHAASCGRQRQIIEAALACFTEKGFPATSIADICKKAGASTGSVYHHFKSKGRLAAAIYLEGVRDYQAGMIDALSKETTAKGGIFAIVQYHLTWVKTHPEWARFLFQKRHAEYMDDTEDRMKQLNAEFVKQMSAWFAKHMESGAIRPLPRDVFSALLLGPCQEFARMHVTGYAKTDVTEAARHLAAAAWASLGNFTINPS